ncbi:flagellar hook protein FlgE [Magnetospirillum sulfuroxidans]|uniref:Flagellar hook protein FlgE n=1 Tax=Magnetospirillum sulfuroxidans TaxID=611300 RepID=A0ABS5IAL9_9PROT|nr:flagellar hook protein FlgE [Magnetospirillum sulfuroxidans]MBR9971465.1 flagellar hook protein FlgE [Magnetospirillum sulfuroxidans]
MSLLGAMNSAVTALKAQSTALAIISDNLSNSSTTGYKASTTSFKTLVTQSYSSTSYASGGVSASVRQNVTNQGVISATSNATDLALDGDGFFVVSYGATGEETFFSRDGEFEIDAQGFMCIGNYYLQGWKTDSDGNVISGSTNSSSTLDAINVNRFTGTAEATSAEVLKANLPADAALNDVVTATMEVFDALGVSHTVTMSYEKTAANEWTLTLADPVLSSDTSSQSGDITGGPFTLTFADGALTGITDSGGTATELEFSITNFTTGASDIASVTMDVGQITGGTGSLTQFASNNDDPDISITSITGDGVEYGALSSVEVDDTGIIWAHFDNGQDIAIYKIAVADFTNANGLESTGYGIYRQTAASGDFTLHEAGEDGVATITASALEGSTVDTSDEFTRMIVAQQAYSAASQVISTCSDMFDELIAAVR